MSTLDTDGRAAAASAVLDGTRRLSAQAVLFTQAVAERLGLAPTDVECVEILAGAGPMSAGELATAIGLTSGATTRMLDRLEQAGFVRRVPDPADRRRVMVEPVNERVAAVTEHFDSLTRANEHAIAEHDEARLDAIRAYLETSLVVARAQTARVREGADAAESRGATFVAPLAGVTRGRLVFLSGAPDVRLRADPALADLCRAAFEGATPRVRVRDGVVTIHYGRFSWLDWRARIGDSRIEVSAHRRRDRGTIDLNATIPWDLDVRGGASNVRGDLTGLDLASLVIAGGVSRVDLRLPAPRRVVPVRVGGGMSDLTLRRPAGTAARLRVRGGASQVTLDGQRVNGVGSVELASPGAIPGAAAYEIDVEGGASRITVETF
jgi:DNA-binding MarR family transcriptional regulator